MDTSTTIQHLKDLMAAFVSERDWDQFHSPKNISMNMAVETAELMEFFIWHEGKESQNLVEAHRDAVEQEIADVMLSILAFCNATNIDLCSAVKRKLVLTGQKYPIEKVKGRLTKYTHIK